MPKNKGNGTDSSYDSDSGPDDRAPPPKAKKTKSEPAKTEAKKSTGGSADKDTPSENGPWTLEGMRQVSVTEFRGRKYVDIREFYSKDGKTLPGKKGISLSINQWLKLMEVAEEVTAAVRNQ